MGGDRIMIVEDEESLLKLESIILTAKGFSVTGVNDGSMALDLIRTQKPDLVLLDVMLPRTDGFEICRNIKGSSDTRHIRVVMLTARKSAGDYARARQSGADAYLTKPFKSVQLLETVESLLERANRE